MYPSKIFALPIEQAAFIKLHIDSVVIIALKMINKQVKKGSMNKKQGKKGTAKKS